MKVTGGTLRVKMPIKIGETEETAELPESEEIAESSEKETTEE